MFQCLLPAANPTLYLPDSSGASRAIYTDPYCGCHGRHPRLCLLLLLRSSRITVGVITQEPSPRSPKFWFLFCPLSSLFSPPTSLRSSCLHLTTLPVISSHPSYLTLSFGYLLAWVVVAYISDAVSTLTVYVTVGVETDSTRAR